MFFSPCGAVLSAILRDEYLTSAVRTKEGVSLPVPSIGKWYPFHIPSLQLCIPVSCCF